LKARSAFFGDGTALSSQELWDAHNRIVILALDYTHFVSRVGAIALRRDWWRGSGVGNVKKALRMLLNWHFCFGAISYVLTVHADKLYRQVVIRRKTSGKRRKAERAKSEPDAPQHIFSASTAVGVRSKRATH